MLKKKADGVMLTVWLFTLTYTISYITRINYGAVISEMEAASGIARSVLSMALTGSFFTYGTGQIISGFLGDRISPKRLVSVGLITTVMMNLLIPVCPSPYLMAAVWCVNGFAQSLMWPPLVRLMNALFTDEQYKMATTKVNCGSLYGTIIVYLAAPLIISFAGWRAVFVFSAIMGIIMLFIWNFAAPDVKPVKRVKAEGGKSAAGALFTPVMICIMIAIIMQGMLRDGVTTWMPTYISETYNMSNVVSILSGVILPLCSVVFMRGASALYQKKIKNPVLCGGVIFGAGAVFAVFVYLLSGVHAVFSIVLFALLTGCMHGVNLCLVCMIPAFFKKYGNVAAASGVINSCTYIGSAASIYGIALLSEKLGWSFTIMTWVIIGTAGCLLCLISAKPFEKEFLSESSNSN